jgi:hypothetical protein
MALKDFISLEIDLSGIKHLFTDWRNVIYETYN